MAVDVFCRINAVDRCNVLCIRSVLLICLHHTGLQVRRVSHIEAVDLAAVQCRRLLETVAGKPQIHVVVRLVHGIVHDDHHEVVAVIGHIELHVLDRLSGLVLIHRKSSVFAGSVGALEDDRCDVLIICKGRFEDRLAILLFCRRLAGKLRTLGVDGDRIFQGLGFVLVVQSCLYLERHLGVVVQHLVTGSIASVPQLRRPVDPVGSIAAVIERLGNVFIAIIVVLFVVCIIRHGEVYLLHVSQ